MSEQKAQCCGESPPKIVKSNSDFPLVTIVASVFLTVTTVSAVIRAQHEPWTIVFCVSIYLSVISFLWCLYVYDRFPEGSPQKRRIKIHLWVLSVLLNVLFSYRVSIILPFILDLFVWTVVVLTSIISFYFMFLLCPKDKCNDKSCFPADGVQLLRDDVP